MPAHWLDLEPPQDVAAADRGIDIAGEVPALAYARRIEQVDGRLVFAGEVPMEHGATFRGLDYLGDDGEPHHCELLRTEYKVPAGAGGPVARGDRLHVAFRPYTNLLSLDVPFRGNLHRSALERARGFGLILRREDGDGFHIDKGTLRFASEAAVCRHVEAQATDYWEQGKYLTAGFSAAPDRAGQRSRNSWKQGYAVLGVCRKGIEPGHLIRTESAARLLQLTEEGPFPVKPGSALRLHPGAKEKALDWLEWAARQALAGPIEHMDAPGGWPAGMPVERQLARRYRNLLISAHRDLTGERRARDAGSRAVDDADNRQADWASFRQYREDDSDDDSFISIEDLEDELGLLD